MNSSSLGPVVVAAGIAIAIVGVVLWSGGLHWFGRLPGDIKIDRGSVRIYIPLVSMLLVSVIFSLIMHLLRKLR